MPCRDELIDELHGSEYCSKLVLRSAYHQILKKEEDIRKTAFKTRDGHHEFLVMPFGLIAPQVAFEPTISKQFLQEFVIIFFDDILVYSPM